jgi:filamentous hemagglutinin family protein
MPAYALDPAALPTGGQVAAGSATINQSAARMDVNQATQKAIINWSTFNIGSGASVNFAQPNSSSVVLNRVLSSSGGSEILGRMTANGQVFLVNPSGVLFGKTAQVDVGGLVATSLNISDSSFLAGRYTFASAGTAGSVTNEGTLRAADGGYIALLAPEVRNDGVIAARLGTVALAAGNKVTLDFAGDRLVSLAIDEAALNAFVENRHVVQADGGTVILAARSAGDLASTVVNNTGLIQAASISERDGVIRLEGGERGVVAVSGTLDASGRGAGERGGTIKVLGDRVSLSSGATLDASGNAGGGTVLVGGNYQGSGPEQNASTTYVAAGAQIKADALNSGDGGKVILWSNEYTEFDGAVSARGGANGGNGGFVEASGKGVLDFQGLVDTRAPYGSTGTLLLDPTNIFIATNQGNATAAGMLSTDTSANTGPTPFTASGAVHDSLLTTGVLNTALGSSSVVVTTTNASGTGVGNITVADPVTWASANTLTLTAANNIAINAGITTGAAGSALILNAAGNVTQSATGIIGGAGGLTQQGAGTVTLSQVNTYTGVTAVNAGTLVASNASALGTTAGGTTVASGATLNINNVAIGAENITSLAGVGVGSAGALTGTGSASLSGNVTMAAASTIGTATGGDSLALSGIVGGAFALTKAGSGTLTLSNVGNTYNGLTTINAGTLSISNNANLGNVAGGIAFGGTGGGTLLTTAGVASARTIALGSVGGTIDDGGNVSSFSGVISGAAGGVLTKAGAGTVTLSVANGYTGGTTIKAGTLSGTNATAFGTGTIVIGDSSGAANATLSGAAAIANPIAVAAGNTGIATITNSAAATFSGLVTLNNHDLRVVAPVAAAVLNLSGGVIGTGNLTLNNNVATANAVTLSGATGVNNIGTITSSGTGGGVTLISAGIGTNVTGVTQNSAASALSVTGALTVNSAGTTLTNSNTQGLTLSGGVGGSGNLTINNNSTGTTTLSGAAVNNAGTITNSGSGSGLTTISIGIGTNVTGVTQNSANPGLTLSAANTYTGTTTISSGTLTLGIANAIGASSAVTVNGTLNLAGFADAIGSLAGNGTITNSGAAATLTVNAAPAPAIQVSSTSINFVNSVVGSTSTQALIIRNTGTANLNISQITESGSAFNISGFTLPLNVNAGQQTTITVAFLPTSVGPVSGSISIVSNAPTSPTSVSLSGTGIAATLTLSISPTSLSFGNGIGMVGDTTDGRPWKSLPVLSITSASVWLLCSVCIERTRHSSSATPPMCGKISVISCPDLPYRLNGYCGAKHISF